MIELYVQCEQAFSAHARLRLRSNQVDPDHAALPFPEREDRRGRRDFELDGER